MTFACLGFVDSPINFLQSFIVRTEEMTRFLTTAMNDIALLEERDIFYEQNSMTLTVVATEANNQTTVQCNDGINNHFSNVSRVIVIGMQLSKH